MATKQNSHILLSFLQYQFLIIETITIALCLSDVRSEVHLVDLRRVTIKTEDRLMKPLDETILSH